MVVKVNNTSGKDAVTEEVPAWLIQAIADGQRAYLDYMLRGIMPPAGPPLSDSTIEEMQRMNLQFHYDIMISKSKKSFLKRIISAFTKIF